MVSRKSVLQGLVFLLGIVSLAHSNPPPFYLFTGEEAGNRFGASVASAGDVNKDGYGDVIVSAPFYSVGDGAPHGRVYVFSGLNGDTLHVFTGKGAFLRFGVSVSSAGDVNNDGFSDLIIGASGAGKAYVFSGLNGDTLHFFSGEVNGDLFGKTVASAGDVNKDGYDDILVGAERSNSATGRAYVFSGLNGDTLHVFTGEAIGSLFGSSVASAGDINFDGYADLIVGASSNDAGGFETGRAYVFSGRDGDTLHIFTGEESYNDFGNSVASAGDVNRDGRPDLIVGAYFYDYNGINIGRVYVFSGRDGSILHVFTGESPNSKLGSSVASAGDVNNDGFSDLIIGASGAGKAYVFSGLDGDTLYVYDSLGGGLSGWVSSAGNVNNDDFDDLIVGAPGFFFPGTTSTGRAFVFLGGRCGDVDGDGVVTQTDLTFLVDFYFLSGVATKFQGADDVNNDSVFDLSDIIYLAEYLNGIGPAPCANGTPPPLFDPKRKPEERQSGSSGY